MGLRASLAGLVAGAPGCETGQIWPKKNGKVVWGACKGEVGRYNVDTGQEKHYWVYPQNRYGHDPDEIKYRFPRQTVVYVSPHDERVIYQASHVLHRSMDEGISWDIVSPDLTAKEPQYQIVSGNPITRDVTGEEVYSTIYSMIESRLERGVIWVGANDGPVSVTRDNGKTWKNVTPKDLVGARIQTVEDSPHMKGRAYIAGYRFMREHDLKPYIYRTDNYGETWTLLTDGKNGIPIDHPTRVIREDPRQAGLLYAGGEFGFFVSFNGGRNWQPLQQNLPTTPITDIKVHRNDLVISTMGRSAWIMDNITPLQELARARDGHAGNAATASASARSKKNSPSCRRWRCSSRARPSAIAAAPRRSRTSIRNTRSRARSSISISRPLPARTPSSKCSTPAAPRCAPGTWRRRRAPARRRRTCAGRSPAARRARPASAPRRACSASRGTFATPVRGRRRIRPAAPAGRWCRPASTPCASPRAARPSRARSSCRSDPRVAADGVTDAAIAEQVKFQLQVRDAISDARKLQVSLEQAMQKAGLKPQLARGAAGRFAEQHQVRPPAAAAVCASWSTPRASTRSRCCSAS